jgi:GNAT superfamily N-acetyltransferase
LEEVLRGDLERLSSDALATQFEHHCPVAGAHPDDYKNRLLHVGGLELLTGIRFLNLDMSQPYVDVIYASEPTLSPEEIEKVKDALRTEYGVFHPLRLRVYRSSHKPPLPGDGDKRLIAAPLRVVAAHDVGPEVADDALSLRPAASLEFYPRYTAIYDRLHTEQPELIPVTHAESEEDMQGYLETGNLYEIFVDGTWAGVCAVFEDARAGIHGFCFGEIVLDPTFRGKGLGSLVQQRLAAQLIARGENESSLLFGTIGAVNHPARRAAARAGRLDLGGHVWLAL